MHHEDTNVDGSKPRASEGKTIDVEIEFTSPRRGTDRDVDGGWAWVVLLATWMSSVLVGCCFGMAGIMYVYLREAFYEDKTLTAWVGSISMGLFHFSGPLAGWLCDRWGCRVSMQIGGVISAVCLAVTSQATVFWLVFLMFGFGVGLGVGLVLTPSYSILGFYFNRRRSLASGLAVLGVPVGIMVTPICLNALERHYGWRGAILVFSAVILHFVICGTICRRSTLECQTQNTRNHRRQDTLSNTKHVVCEAIGTCCALKRGTTLLKKADFISFVVACSLSNFGISIIYLHLPSYTFSQGGTLNDLQHIYMFMAAANVLCKVLTGLGSGRVKRGKSIDKMCLIFGAYSMAGTTLLVLPSVAQSQIGRVVCLAIVSFYYNVEPPLYVPISLELIDLADLSIALGLEMFGIGFGFLLGPPFAAWIYAFSGDYNYSFYSAGFAYHVAAIFCLVMMRLKGKQPSQYSPDKQAPTHPINDDTAAL